jgi:hypothetical protein
MSCDRSPVVKYDMTHPFAALTCAWKKEANPAAVNTLITLLLDRIDDPLLSTQPLSVPENERTYLLTLAQQRWPDEVAWDELVLPDEDASATSSQGHAALLATMLDRATSPRQWDATVAQLSQRLAAHAMLTLLEQSGRTDTLAMVWQAIWCQALDRRACFR